MESQPPMTPEAKTARILIVEDHPTIAELVETRLRIEGMRPTKCLGGREALQVLEHGEFDLVILDVVMPDVDGYEVFRFLKGSSRTRGLPVIFLTAKSSPGDVEHGVALGADYYITKPFSGSDLMRKVRNVLARQRPDVMVGERCSVPRHAIGFAPYWIPSTEDGVKIDAGRGHGPSSVGVVIERLGGFVSK